MGDRTTSFSALDEIELLDFFGVEPLERDAADGYWAYEVTDQRGVTLRFSFSLYERSVQTVVRLGESVVASVSYEGAVSMRREGAVLRCDFLASGAKGTLSMSFGEAVRVDWATLRV